MPIKTKLPKGAPLVQHISYPFIKNAFYFLFGFLPYGPVRRERVPDLSGPVLIAGSHSNFLCDPVINGFETVATPRFLGKHTLFRFPMKWLVTFCGAIPVYRPQDMGEFPVEGRATQNRTAFKSAIQALQDGWPVCIYPEGGSFVTPGLHLPLKPGVAKLALTAEEFSDFKLGLRIIPVGLEYGSRPKVGSGLTIRYGEPISVSSYRDIYEKSYGEAVRKLMADLTEQMKAVFPHFESNEELLLAKKMIVIGASPNRMSIAKIFRRYREQHPEILSNLQHRLRDFEEASKDQGIPMAAWGYRRKVSEKSLIGKILSMTILLGGAPLFLWDLINNTFSEYLIRSAMGFASSDETEMMTVRFFSSFIILPPVYYIQLWGLSRYFAPGFFGAPAFFFVYLGYFIFSASVWVVMPRWRRQFKTWAAQLFFIGKHKPVIEELDQVLTQLNAWVREEGDPSRT